MEVQVSDDGSTHNLPTIEDLCEWRKERDELVAQEKEIKRRRTTLDKLIEAGSAFVKARGKGVIIQVGPTHRKTKATPMVPVGTRQKSHRPRDKTWTATILKIMTDKNQGMTYGELKEEIGKTHHGETLRRTDKAFYGGIGKLAKNNKIVKHKGRVYTPKAYQQFMGDVEAGLALDEPAPSSFAGHDSPNKVAIIDLLTARPNGLATGEIIESLLKNPTTKEAVTRNRTPVYNLLARLVKRKKLIKRNGKYYLFVSRVETPGSSEPSAPNHKGNGGGAPLSSGGKEPVRSFAALPGASPAQPGE